MEPLSWEWPPQGSGPRRAPTVRAAVRPPVTMASGHDAGPGHKGLAVTVETPLPVCGQPPGDTVPPLNMPKEVLCHPKLLFLCSPERVPPLGSNSLRLR